MRIRNLVLGCAGLVLLVGIYANGDNKKDEEKTLSLKQLPKKVQQLIKKEAEGSKIVEIERINRDGQAMFEVDLVKDGKEIDLIISRRGKLIAREIDEADDHDDDDERGQGDEDHDDDDEQVCLSQLPECVKSLIKLVQSQGAEVTGIERIVAYEIEFMVDGKEVEIIVSSDDNGHEDDDDDEDEEDEDDYDDDEDDHDEDDGHE